MKFYKDIWDQQAGALLAAFHKQYPKKNTQSIPKHIVEELIVQAFVMGAEAACKMSEALDAAEDKS